MDLRELRKAGADLLRAFKTMDEAFFFNVRKFALTREFDAFFELSEGAFVIVETTDPSSGLVLPHVAASVELVEPNVFGRFACLENEHHGFDARSRERAARHIEDGVEVARFQEQLAQSDRGVVGIT